VVMVEAELSLARGYGPLTGVSNESHLVAAVNRVIDRREITTVFQPLVDLASAEVVGYEAFTRGPAGSEMESPLTLLEGARLAGRLAEFDWICAAGACESVLAARLHPSTTIFLNIKPATMLATCPEDLRRVIWRAQNNLRIVVDMNEEAMTEDPASLFDAVRAVRDVGWGIAIDNAVADPAAMALLPLVRPDVLKLDFRGGLRGRLADIAKMGEGARAYSEQTGATILAQGIEDQDDVWSARLAGARFGQGWYFGRPGPLPGELATPTSVFPLVQRSPVVDRSTPFEIITKHCAAAITEERFLVPMRRHLEEQVDTNGPHALLLQTFGPEAEDAERVARLCELARRAAFLAVLDGWSDWSTITGPTVRTGRCDPLDAIAAEWNVIVLGPHYAVAVTARAIDGAHAGASRRFEYALTHDREVIIRAASALWARLPKRAAFNTVAAPVAAATAAKWATRPDPIVALGLVEDRKAS
jgi:EAL domain-containing protein (putative c-di-GMP-specific phosphodiesterase class I)